jgi:hypothetical protein
MIRLFGVSRTVPAGGSPSLTEPGKIIDKRVLVALSDVGLDRQSRSQIITFRTSRSTLKADVDQSSASRPTEALAQLGLCRLMAHSCRSLPTMATSAHRRIADARACMSANCRYADLIPSASECVPMTQSCRLEDPPGVRMHENLGIRSPNGLGDGWPQAMKRGSS